ncbi:hypothetical protein [Bombilactobacillus thymidiniphilus]|nr:hypothetical protein [Bombilactobacillus thymidiniphilus]
MIKNNAVREWSNPQRALEDCATLTNKKMIQETTKVKVVGDAN